MLPGKAVRELTVFRMFLDVFRMFLDLVPSTVYDLCLEIRIGGSLSIFNFNH